MAVCRRLPALPAITKLVTASTLVHTMTIAAGTAVSSPATLTRGDTAAATGERIRHRKSAERRATAAAMMSREGDRCFYEFWTGLRKF